MKRTISWVIVQLCAFATAVSSVSTKPAPRGTHKIIIDTDFNTIGDDGQVLAMAAQLHKSKVVDILGVTVVTGNQWLAQGVSDALKAVERLGIEQDVGVYAGAHEPFLHTYAAHQLEKQRFGNGTQYVGAYGTPPPPLGRAARRRSWPRPTASPRTRRRADGARPSSSWTRCASTRTR
ncbi:hypothetical protein PG994_003588 [Apiospora phragmitis]|uniref:Inosine/uridine-preferring nucleoside hydrolase domain-containing protein n=1 Tax=Apiospora phragmitis TaxID=2905665 RepID=A0ABR1VYH4_9PEZI